MPVDIARNTKPRRLAPRSAPRVGHSVGTILSGTAGDPVPAARAFLLRFQRRRRRRFSRPDPKLEYIQDLGATAVWLMPFYPSPLKDDGYDIADYRNVHPSYGTLADFKTFLREAHRMGLARDHENWSSTTPRTSIPGFSGRGGVRPAVAGATSTSGATGRTGTRRRGSSSRTTSRRIGPGIRWREPTIGIASTITSRI
jgi:hypothetical protein